MADKSKSQGGSSSGAASRSQSKSGSKSEVKGEEKKTSAKSQSSGGKSQSSGGKSQSSGARSQSQSGGGKSQSGGSKSQSQSSGGSGSRAESRSTSDFSSSSRAGQSGGQQSRGRQGEPAGFDREEAIVTLNNLLIADYDAVGLYERVLQNLDNDRLKSTVEGFRGDHERHIRELTEAIRNMGGEPMTRPSLMGPIGKVVATIASTLMGNKGALQALMQGEQYTNSTYAGASITNLPDQLRELVVRNSQDEQRHLQWVTETLDNM